MRHETGRLKETIDPDMQRVVYGRSTPKAKREAFRLFAILDECAAILLTSAKVLPVDDARSIVAAIEAERGNRFKGALAEPAPRGAYLAWESYMGRALPDRLVGALHLGRSRNDITSTIQRMRLRAVQLVVAKSRLRLLRALLAAADRDWQVVIPAFTHGKPAVPIRAAHLWFGWAFAVVESLKRTLDCFEEIDVLPLGAAAIAGSTIPLNQDETARFLGFNATDPNSIRAIASRSYLLRALGEAVIAGTDLSRFAADLQAYSSGDKPLLRWPDALLGSSSNMPQKANPFLSELVQGRSVVPLQSFVGVATKLHSVPFTNSFVVSTEVEKGIREDLQSLADSEYVLAKVVEGIRFDEANCRARCIDGLTFATAAAEALVLQTGLSFRQAHREIGALTTEPSTAFQSIADLLSSRGVENAAARLDPVESSNRCEVGGGTGAVNVHHQREALRVTQRSLADRLRRRIANYHDAELARECAIRALLSGG